MRSLLKTCSIIIVLVNIPVYANGAKADSSTENSYKHDHHSVRLGNGPSNTVLTGFLLEDSFANLIAINKKSNGTARARIYAFEKENWGQVSEIILGQSVSFVDVVEINGRDRLVTYENGQFRWLNLETNSFHDLVNVESIFAPQRTDEIPQVDISHDLNGDGLDDLVVPTVTGYSVFVQIAGGRFAEPMIVGSVPSLEGIYGADGYRFDPWSQSRVFPADYNQDGRTDLMYWKADRFAVHLQDQEGQFAVDTVSCSFSAPFEIDNPYSLAAGHQSERALHTIADVNGDQLADLVVLALSGKSIERKISAFEIYLGNLTPENSTSFETKPSLNFQSNDRVVFDFQLVGLNQGPPTDIMITSIDEEYLKGSLWKSLKGFMGDDIKLNLEFYRPSDGRFADTPNSTKTIALDGEPSNQEPGSVTLDLILRGATHENRNKPNPWPRAFNRPLLLGDVTGDGLNDLFVGTTPEGMNYFTGVSGSSLFTNDSNGERILLPSDNEFVWLVDLNKDDKLDMVLHQPTRDRIPVHPQAKDRPRSITTLISK